MMVVNETEKFEKSPRFVTHFDSMDDEAYLVIVDDTWHLMYPEVIEDDNSPATSNHEDDFVDNETIKGKTVGSSSPSFSESSSEDLITLNKLEEPKLVNEKNMGSTDIPSSVELNERPLDHNTEFELNEVAPLVMGKTIGSSGSSSSSSSEFSEDLINLNKLQEPELENDKNMGSTDILKSVEPNERSLNQNTELELAHEALVLKKSPMESPKVQVMERDNGLEYDPKRIPASVFVRSDSLIPAEWSAASTESLFSIHAGSNSFGRDHPFLGKYGLTKSGELAMPSPSLSKSAMRFDDERERLTINELKSIGKKEEDEVETRTDMGMITLPVDAGHSVSGMRASNVSRQSAESEGSTYSFAFPILTDGARRSVSANPIPAEHFDMQPRLEAENSKTNSTSAASGSNGRCFSCFSRFSCFSSSCFSCRSCFSCCPRCCCV